MHLDFYPLTSLKDSPPPIDLTWQLDSRPLTMHLDFLSSDLFTGLPFSGQLYLAAGLPSSDLAPGLLSSDLFTGLTFFEQLYLAAGLLS